MVQEVKDSTNIYRSEAVMKEYINKKFWEEPIAYFPLLQHGLHRKRRLQQFFVATGTSLLNHYLATKGGIHFTEPLLMIGGIHIQTHRPMGGIYEVHR
jgi:hypothetical protein